MKFFHKSHQTRLTAPFTDLQPPPEPSSFLHANYQHWQWWQRSGHNASGQSHH